MKRNTLIALIVFTATSSHACADDVHVADSLSNTDWRLIAIPQPKSMPTALNYHDLPLNLNNPLSKEPLVDLNTLHIANESYYARKDGFNAPYYKSLDTALAHVWLRKTVAQKLIAVNAGLKKYGVEVLVLDGYRPVECQRQLWNYFLQEAKSKLGTTGDKSADEKAYVEYAGKYCSNPTKFDRQNIKTWPTHATGGAVDITLRRLDNGEPLFMGSVFDDASAISYTDSEEKEADSSASIEDARRNRRLLFWAMTYAGFANYPYEWWHFDFANQMWLQNRQVWQAQPAAAEANYGLADLKKTAR